jgi:hypothetical protein
MPTVIQDSVVVIRGPCRHAREALHHHRRRRFHLSILELISRGTGADSVILVTSLSQVMTPTGHNYAINLTCVTTTVIEKVAIPQAIAQVWRTQFHSGPQTPASFQIRFRITRV